MTSDLADAPSVFSEHFTLASKAVGSLSGVFFVPRYQRGYRWEKDDVRRLLDDLREFIESSRLPSSGATYNLQPIVIKCHGESPRSNQPEWELIDGQQRLTTLFVILRYLRRQNLTQDDPPFSLRYDTRARSLEFLSSLGEDDRSDQERAEDNIDFHHLYHAYHAVSEWFSQKMPSDQDRKVYARRLDEALSKTVCIIWYEAPPAANATELFTRLNVGRIALTDAELVKAALLLKLRNQKTDARAYEVAAQWDVIEQDLQREDIWAFISGMSDSSDARLTSRISLLLDSLAEMGGKSSTSDRPRYFTFETLRNKIEDDPDGFWQQVVNLHAHVIGWHRDFEVHNRIGFLVAVSKRSATEFSEIANQALNNTKTKQVEYLDNRIRASLGLSKEKIHEISYGEDAGQRSINDALLLANVITVCRTGDRFPFDRHLRHKWSLEHIHAQNADGPKTVAYWREWLKEHSSALETVASDETASDISSLVVEIKTAIEKLDSNHHADSFKREDFLRLSTKILDFMGMDAAPDHGLRNMALLTSEHNSYLNNAAFEVKRRRIVERDEKGEYIPVCTRNVFLKYYSNSKKPHFWGEDDKKYYMEKLVDLLSPYLTERVKPA